MTAGGAGGLSSRSSAFEERRFSWGAAVVVAEQVTREGVPIPITSEDIHDMTAGARGLTLHFYNPPASSMRVFDLQRAEMLELIKPLQRLIPQGDHRVPFAQIAPKRQARRVIWVAPHQYRGGSAEFAVLANTMARELAVAHPDAEVVVSALHYKADSSPSWPGSPTQADC
jgi:hypothetical protein